MCDTNKNEFYIRKSLLEAKKAFNTNEIPIGSIIVLNDKIIAKAYNQVELLRDSTAHAEMLAISTACHFLQSKFLDGAILYCTVEPCLMCYGAIKNSRIKKICFGIEEPKTGFLKYIKTENTKIEIVKGILKMQCLNLMQKFFRQKR